MTRGTDRIHPDSQTVGPLIDVGNDRARQLPRILIRVPSGSMKHRIGVTYRTRGLLTCDPFMLIRYRTNARLETCRDRRRCIHAFVLAT